MLCPESLSCFALKSVQHAVVQDKHCFELYGYDVMVDEDLVPWLIEVCSTANLEKCQTAQISKTATGCRKIEQHCVD